MAKTNKDSRIQAVRKRIVPVSATVEHIKVLLYGQNGKGKTRTAATLGEVTKTLLIDVNEKGTTSIRNFPNIDVFPAKTWEDVIWAYWFLKSGEHEYGGAIIDTLTMAQDMCMKQVLKEAEDRDPAKDPVSAAPRDWGKMGQLMKNTLLFYRNLPMHVVFVAQERAAENEEGETEKVPALSPMGRLTATSCVDFIGHIRAKEVRAVNKRTKRETKAWKTVMLIGPHETYLTKDRSGQLDRLIANPTMSQIIAAAHSEE